MLEGEEKEIVLSYEMVEDSEELALYYEYMAVDDPIYSAEEIQENFLVSDGASVTIEDISEMANEMTAYTVQELKEGQ